MRISDKVRIVDGSWAMARTEKGLVRIHGIELTGRDWVVVATGHDFPTEEDRVCPAKRKNNVAVYDGRIVVYTRSEYLKPVDNILQERAKEEAYGKGRRDFKREAIEVVESGIITYCGCYICKGKKWAEERIRRIV